MVVSKSSGEEPACSSYDELDIINEFIEMHSKDEKRRLNGEDANDISDRVASTTSLPSSIESDKTIYLNNSDMPLSLGSPASSGVLYFDSNSEIHNVKAESSIYLKNVGILNKISNGAPITVEELSAMEEPREEKRLIHNPGQGVAIEVCTVEDKRLSNEEKSVVCLENSNDIREMEMNGGLLLITEKPVENGMKETPRNDFWQEKGFQKPRIQSLANKCIFSHSDKIIPYDSKKTKPIKSKKQNIKRNVYDLGKVEAGMQFSINGQLKPQSRINHKNVIEESNQPSTPDPVVDVLDVVRMQRSLQNNNWVSVSNTFFVGKAQAKLNITDVVTHADFIEREVYDKLEKRSRFGKMTENYVVLTENTFSCYRSKKKKIQVPEEDKEGFPCFDDQWFYFPEKYCLDLKNTELFIITGDLSYKRSLLCCCSNAKLISSSLQNINAMEINSIQQTEAGHSIFFQNENGYDIFEIRDFDFVLHSEGEYHWFRCKNATTFSKWITAIQLRKREGLVSTFE